jgi:hypothetical protein
MIGCSHHSSSSGLQLLFAAFLVTGAAPPYGPLLRQTGTFLRRQSIPAHLWQTHWLPSNLPNATARAHATWINLNPGLNHTMMDDEEAEQVRRSAVPSANLELGVAGAAYTECLLQSLVLRPLQCFCLADVGSGCS